MIRGASLLAVAPTRIPGGQGLAWFSVAVTDDELLAVVHEAVDAVVASFDGHDDWGLSGGRDGQYASDLVADSAALSVLQNAGLAVLSEESGRSSDAELVAVLDPLDGSTNASRPLPWFATSICVVDGDRPRVAVVHDHASGVRWDAIAGGGARVDGAPLPRRAPVPLDEAIVAINALAVSESRLGSVPLLRCCGARSVCGRRRPLRCLRRLRCRCSRPVGLPRRDVDLSGVRRGGGGRVRPTPGDARSRCPAHPRGWCGEAFTALLAARRAESDR